MGVIYLRDGKVSQAIELLQNALKIARKINDRSLESDAQTNLGPALQAAGKLDNAKELLEIELAHARVAKDRFQEKVVLGYLGAVYAKLRHHAQAILIYEQAVALARELGDRRHQAELHWLVAVQNAELGQRDLAIADGQAAIDLLRKMANPQVAAYVEFLARYCVDVADNKLQKPEPVNRSGFLGRFDQTVIVSAGGTQSGPDVDPPQTHGSGLLRMALSATKSMTKFLNSGFKTVPSITYQKRLESCAICPHYTGMRCKLCGCFTSIKARLPHETCPLSKWPH